MIKGFHFPPITSNAASTPTFDRVSPKNVVHGTRYMKEQMALLDG